MYTDELEEINQLELLSSDGTSISGLTTYLYNTMWVKDGNLFLVFWNTGEKYYGYIKFSTSEMLHE